MSQDNSHALDPYDYEPLDSDDFLTVVDDLPVDPYDDYGYERGPEPTKPNLTAVPTQNITTVSPLPAPSPTITEGLVVSIPIGGTWDLSEYFPTGNRGASGAKQFDSAVAPLVSEARGYEHIEDPADLKKYPGIPDARKSQGARFKRYVLDQGLMIMPWFRPQDVSLAERGGTLARPCSIQVKPGGRPEADEKTGKERGKYEFAAGSPTPLGMHPAIPSSWLNSTDVASETAAPRVLIAEGLLKGDSALTAYLLSQGCTPEDLAATGETRNVEEARTRLRALLDRIPVENRVLILAVAGVDNWKKNPEWYGMNLRGLDVWLGVDGDVASNPNVYRATSQAWEYLKDHQKANPSLLAPTVQAEDGEKKIGIDDYLAKYGDWGSLLSRMSTSLPDNPLTPAQVDLMSRLGEKRLAVDMTKGVTTRVTVEPIENPFGGPPTAAREVHERIVDLAVEVVETHEISDRLSPRAPKRIRHTLRVKAGEIPPVIIYDVSDEDLSKPEKITRLAGAATMHAATWHETPSPGLDREIGAAVRVNVAPDYKTHRVQRQTGHMTIPAIDGPDTLDRANLVAEPAQSDTVWAWTKDGMGGAAGPDHLTTPDVASSAPEVGDRDIPAYQEVRYVLADIRTLLTETLGAFNDSTAFHACLGRAGSAYMGARPRGGLHIWGERKIGKSEWLKWMNGMAFGSGEPPSVVNNSRGFLLSYAKNRSGILTIADDRKRIAGDYAEWPMKNLNASLFCRAAYDGPGALRNSQRQGQDGDWEITLAGKIYPTTILGGELAPDWDPSTLSKILDIHCAKDFIKPGQAAKVIARQADEGLPTRLARAYIAYQCNEIPRRHLKDATQSVDALENYWASEFRKAHGIGDDKTPAGYAWEQMSDEQRATAESWTERPRDVLTGLLYGLVELATWMKAVADATPDIALGVETHAMVEVWLRRALDEVFEAQNAWQAECEESEYNGASGGMGVLGGLQMALMQERAYIEGASQKDYLPSKAVFIGKASGSHTVRPDKDSAVEVTIDTVDLDPASVAKLLDTDVATVKDALRHDALRNNQGKYGFTTTLNGVSRPTMRLPRDKFFGADHLPTAAVQEDESSDF